MSCQWTPDDHTLECAYDVSDEDAHLPEPCGRPGRAYGTNCSKTKPLCAKHAKALQKWCRCGSPDHVSDDGCGHAKCGGCGLYVREFCDPGACHAETCHDGACGKEAGD